MHTTTEKLLETFSLWSVLKLYEEDQWDQDSQREIRPDLGLKRVVRQYSMVVNPTGLGNQE
jgi:hypothetical protein